MKAVNKTSKKVATARKRRARFSEAFSRSDVELLCTLEALYLTGATYGELDAKEYRPLIKYVYNEVKQLTGSR